MSWVYLVHAVGTDNYKIGRSEQVRARVAALATASPTQIALVAAWRTPQPDLLERRLLSSCERVDGGGTEWVRLAAVPLAVFDEVARQCGGVRAQLDVVVVRDGKSPLAPLTPVVSVGGEMLFSWEAEQRFPCFSKEGWIALAKEGKVIGSKPGKVWLFDAASVEQFAKAYFASGRRQSGGAR